jgi:mTERF domain-containing protein, mitochondrial
MRRFFQSAPKLVNFSRYCTAVEAVKPHNELTLLTEKVDSNRKLIPGEDYPVYTVPSFNFAAYVNKSETLQKLLELGVDLSKIEKKKGYPQYVLSLDFNRDIKDRIILLHDLGIPAENFGELFTKNPFFFKNTIEDLETRIFYLRSKKFTIDQVRTIVIKDPFWLNFSTQRIDRRLGWFQKNFGLTGDDMRFVVTRYPRLFTSSMQHVKEMIFSIKEEMGFDKDEVKILLMASPKIFMRGMP